MNTTNNDKEKTMPKMIDQREVAKKQAQIRRSQQILALERQGYTREDAALVYDNLLMARDFAQVARMMVQVGGMKADQQVVKESNQQALDLALKAVEVAKKYKTLGVCQMLDQLVEQLKKAA
jgi:hypothetical protein